MAKFAVAGIVQVETIVRVDSIPVSYSPVINKPDTIFTNVGGDAYNERVALKALGDEVEFFSMVGKHDLSWERAIMSFRYLIPHPQRSSFMMINGSSRYLKISRI